MGTNKYLKLLREIDDASFASIDEFGNPQVRIIDVMYVEGEKLYFVTSRGKNFHKEILTNNKIAIVGLSKDYKSIRLNGEVKKVANQKMWVDKIFEENPVLNNVYPGDSRYILDAFVIEKGNGELFDLRAKPIFRESFSLANEKISKKGFYIGEDCIACGICLDNCPQGIILEGSPFKIQENNCLHCGLCFENCPSGAIYKY